MREPDLFQFQSSTGFLKAYFAYRTSQNPEFTYGLWSRKLQLGNTASLTRIVNGDRHPGEKVIEELVRFFGFERNQAEYFRVVTRLEKEKDSVLKGLLLNQLNQIKSFSGNHCVQERVAPITTLKANLFLLWGSAEPRKLNQHLDQFRLQSNTILGFGRAIVCLKGAIVSSSAFGPYLEFNFASHVLKKGNPFSMMNMYFDFLHASKPAVCDSWTSWGSPYTCRRIEVQSSGPRDCDVRLYDGESCEFRFVMGRTDEKFTSNWEKFNIRGYNSLLGREHCFRILMSSNTDQRDYDPCMDSIEWASASSLGALLKEIDFEPTRWSVHPDFQATIYSPELR